MPCQLRVWRWAISVGRAALFLAMASAARAQADSALIRRILTAEDRRDSLSGALTEGLASRDPRVQLLARRARARITDSKFANRDSLPAPTPGPHYPEPAWRLRYRALATKKADCSALRSALADSAWQV